MDKFNDIATSDEESTIDEKMSIFSVELDKGKKWGVKKWGTNNFVDGNNFDDSFNSMKQFRNSQDLFY